MNGRRAPFCESTVARSASSFLADAGGAFGRVPRPAYQYRRNPRLPVPERRSRGACLHHRAELLAGERARKTDSRKNQNGSDNTATSPASPNSEITLYLTGYGVLDDPPEDGVAQERALPIDGR
ncbi:MAG: hypothetical protein HS123_15685 [Solibacteraceae bacterium]|nr:hypothetical protein [Solibacteraceae bacterium]